MVETPVTHEVARKTAVATKTIDVLRSDNLTWQILVVKCLSTTNSRVVWHFETVRHVTSEADIEDCRLYTSVLDNINNLGV